MTASRTGWFQVDHQGLQKLMGRESLARVIYELVSNAWDEPGVTTVDVRLVTHLDRVELIVTDDAPDGFKDLKHAYTLFAESAKAGNLNQRGRFNLGEKLALAACERASIMTTTGTVRFKADGTRRIELSTKSRAGSVFHGVVTHPQWLRISKELMDELHLLRAPAGIKTRISVGDSSWEVEPSAPFAKFEVMLPTEAADGTGMLRRFTAPMEVRLLKCPDHRRKAWLLELGIPVVELDTPFDIDVSGKVRLTLDRSNAAPAFIHRLCEAVLERATEHLTDAEVHEPWVSRELENVTTPTLGKLLDRRYSTKRVAYDPSDPEANHRAVAEGYVVVHGNSLSAGAWAVAKSCGLIKPAGQVFPTKMPVFAGPGEDGKDITIDPERWTEAQRIVVNKMRWLAQKLLGREILVSIVHTDQYFAACYGQGNLMLNVFRLGKAWFEPDNGQRLGQRHLELVLHELAHEYCTDHLSSKFHDAICTLGAKLAMVTIKSPGIVTSDFSGALASTT